MRSKALVLIISLMSVSAFAGGSSVQYRAETSGSLAAIDISGSAARGLFNAMSNALETSVTISSGTYTTRIGTPSGLQCTRYTSSASGLEELTCTVGFRDVTTGTIDNSEPTPTDPFQN